jgi:hypothetical protein
MPLISQGDLYKIQEFSLHDTLLVTDVLSPPNNLTSA